MRKDSDGLDKYDYLQLVQQLRNNQVKFLFQEEKENEIPPELASLLEAKQKISRITTKSGEPHTLQQSQQLTRGNTAFTGETTSNVRSRVMSEVPNRVVPNKVGGGLNFL